MLVWGGRDFSGTRLNTGGRYDAATDSWTPTSTLNAPSARYQHTAVWSGSLMLVWGGGENTGGRYDPATDAWTPTSTLDAPSARFSPTAVWTGSLMLVWGGWVSSSKLNTGGRYDPATDSWTPTSTTGAPSARDFHTAVWTGSLMLVWGGWGNSGGYLNSGGRYDPATDFWTPTSTHNAPSARGSHTAVWTGSLMLVWGGDTGGRYDAGQPVDPADDDDDGFGKCTGDCDDANAAVYPSAPQMCDGVNNDCGHSNWPSLTGTNEMDDDGDSLSECQGDCNDADPTTYPSAQELCDGRDNDCDLVVDEGDPGGGLSCNTGLLGVCAPGTTICQAGSINCSPNVSPSPEVCDALDNDCDGPVDEDAVGEDSDGDAVHNACDNCVSAYNPTQADSDHDRVGNSCDNCILAPNPSQTDTDADQRGNACDNCPLDYNTLQDNFDGDLWGDVCDNCILVRNDDQADMDVDFEGDACDLNDGFILLRMATSSIVAYQREDAYAYFNIYRASMTELLASGIYTQDPNQIAGAAQFCTQSSGSVFDPYSPLLGEVVFYLGTGVSGSEDTLGTDSLGNVRPNDNPCP